VKVEEEARRVKVEGRGSSLATPWWRAIDGAMVGNGSPVGTRHSSIDAHSTVHDVNQ
jgi:hypothetical protein